MDTYARTRTPVHHHLYSFTTHFLHSAANDIAAALSAHPANLLYTDFTTALHHSPAYPLLSEISLPRLCARFCLIKNFNVTLQQVLPHIDIASAAAAAEAQSTEPTPTEPGQGQGQGQGPGQVGQGQLRFVTAFGSRTPTPAGCARQACAWPHRLQPHTRGIETPPWRLHTLPPYRCGHWGMCTCVVYH